MTTVKVLFDACVLIPINLCDVFLRLAEAEVFSPLWTEEILGEVERNLVARIGLPRANAARRVRFMTEAFPEAMVTGYEHLTDSMTCDPKDRHVLAGAVRSRADMLVTANVKDFPLESTAPYDVEVLHPDPFLLDQLDLFGRETLQVIREIDRRRKRPPHTEREILVALRSTVPHFAQVAWRSLNDPSGLGESVWMYRPEEDADAQERELFYPGGIDDLKNPRTVAWRWYTSVIGAGHDEDFRSLAANARDFPKRAAMSELLAPYGLGSYVDFAIDAPELVAYMKLVPSEDRLLQAMNSGVHNDALALTLARLTAADEWRVFSVGGRYSTPGEIFRTGE